MTNNIREIQARNIEFYQVLKSWVMKTNSISKFVSFSKYLGRFLVFNPCGVYVDPDIELKAMSFSARLFANDIFESVKNGKTLHIISTAFKTGGHTRVLESWLQIDSDVNDVAILNQYPNYKLITPDKTKIFDLYDLSLLDRIVKLRNIAKDYEFVVLHIHPEDLSAVIALGHNFPNKILFYNHADHLFSYGPYFSDAILNISTQALDFSLVKRAVSSAFKLVVPMPAEDFGSAKHEKNLVLKKKLGLENKKIILSIGAPYKFIPNSQFNIFRIIEELAAQSDVHFVLIGPDSSYKKYYSGKNVSFLGLIDYVNIKNYYSIADAYLDSIPMGGGVALSKALAMDIPSVSTLNGYHLFDFTLKICVPYVDIAKRLIQILERGWTQEMSEAKALFMEHEPSNWLMKKNEIFSKVVKRKHFDANLKIERDPFTQNQIRNSPQLIVPITESRLPLKFCFIFLYSQYLSLEEKLLIPLKLNVGKRMYKFLYNTYHASLKYKLVSKRR